MLSDNSQNLAQRYRQKIADNYEGNKITVLDILTAQTNKEQWIEETKKEQEMKESEECTFHPMTNSGVIVKPDETMTSHGDKCYDLYHLSSVRPRNKNEKTREDYEYEKYGKECTFKPNIIKENKRPENKPHYVNQRSIQETLDRMKRGREERDFKKKMTERGYGEPTQSTNKPAKKKQNVKRPMNYSVPGQNRARNGKGVSSVATEGTKSKKEESKVYSGIHSSKKRRSPQERNQVARATKSSQMKTRSNQPAKPTPKTAKSNKPVRAIEHKKFDERLREQENIQDPEQMYRNIEEEEREIIEKEREAYGEQPESQEYDNQELSQEPLDKYVEGHKESLDYEMNQSYGEDEGEHLHVEESPGQEQYEGEGDNQRAEDEGEGNPLLFVDVNLGQVELKG